MNSLEQLIDEFITLNGMECEEALSFLEELETMTEVELKEGVDLAAGKYRDKLLDGDRCPECGGELTYERDPAQDNYVPYGDTQVLESEGFITKCESCNLDF